MRQLIHSLRAAKDANRPFALLIGAGVSRTAGIPTAAEMALELASRYYREDKSNDPPSTESDLWAWAEQQEWYILSLASWGEDAQDTDTDMGFLHYAACMDRLDPEERRKYVIDCCKRAGTPNSAYAAIAQLIDQNFVSTVLTTNFDELMRRALNVYNEVPTVCEHVETARHFVAAGIAAPLIVHLHGSANFYDTCHTLDNVARLNEDMSELVRWTVAEKGVLVVGYRGAELGVMNALSEQLSRRSPPFRLYWAAHEKTEADLTDPAREILSLHGNEHLVMYDQDADEFFADVCGDKGLRLPREVPDKIPDAQAVMKRISITGGEQAKPEPTDAVAVQSVDERPIEIPAVEEKGWLDHAAEFEETTRRITQKFTGLTRVTSEYTERLDYHTQRINEWVENEQPGGMAEANRLAGAAAQDMFHYAKSMETEAGDLEHDAEVLAEALPVVISSAPVRDETREEDCRELGGFRDAMRSVLATTQTTRHAMEQMRQASASARGANSKMDAAIVMIDSRLASIIDFIDSYEQVSLKAIEMIEEKLGRECDA